MQQAGLICATGGGIRRHSVCVRVGVDAVSACERVGHERKPSNRAAIRRQCPSTSHGWILDVVVENRGDGAGMKKGHNP